MTLGPVLRATQAIQDYLNTGKSPEKTDCIFVFAGRPERKRFGLQLFHQGVADTVVFSVGRFEWRRFLELGLADNGSLYNLVEKTPPHKRHFFVHLNRSTVRCSTMEKHRFGTMSEALAFSRYIEKEGFRSVLIVSSGFHLRRATESLEHFCVNSNPKLTPVAVPTDFEHGTGNTQIATGEPPLSILKEYFKCQLYRLLRHFHFFIA